MKCRTTVRSVSLLLDDRLSAGERRDLEQHLQSCPDCALSAHQLSSLSESLRELPVRPVPADLAMSLRATASQARAERSSRATLAARLEYGRQNVRLWMDNLMRPFAVPVAGGLLSAVFLFMVLAPIYSNPSRTGTADVPTTLTRPAAIKQSVNSAVMIETVLVVEVWVDRTGRLIDYSIPPGQDWPINESLRRSIEEALLCTEFEPATLFGRPAASKLQITLRHDMVEVKG